MRISVLAVMISSVLALDGQPPSQCSTLPIVDEASDAVQVDTGKTATPRVHLVINMDRANQSYADAEFNVSDDAYVMVVAVDLDHKPHVLFPESAEETGFVKKGTSQSLRRVYAGVGDAVGKGTSRAQGKIIAISSSGSLNYAQYEGTEDGWDSLKLLPIVGHGPGTGVANALGYSLIAKGQEFYSTFSPLSFKLPSGASR